jgi:membrane protease YdiL (CAAX protease family)
LCADGDSIEGVSRKISEAYGWRETLMVLVLFFAPVLLVVPVGAIWTMIDRGALKRAIAADNIGLTSLVIASVVALVSLSLVIVYMSARNSRHCLTWAAFGFRKAPLGRSVKYIVGFFGLATLTVVAFAVTAVLLGLPEPATATRPDQTALSWALVLVGAVVAGPAAEEIVFRGLLFGRLREHYRFAIAALLSSLAFALVHLNPAVLVTALPLGIYLCFMYKRLGSIVPGMVLHMMWNFMVSTIR